MFVLILIGATIALIAGGIAKVVADRLNATRDLREDLTHVSFPRGFRATPGRITRPRTRRITAFEFALGLLLVTAVTTPLITVVGVNIARASTISYPEYWGGWEKDATASTITCTLDGSCRHTYNCDPYIYIVHYTERVQTGTRRVTHGTGKNKYTSYEPVYKDVPRTRPETRYHDCPYTTTETTYVVTDTLGDTHTLGDHWAPANPDQNRYRAGVSVPSRIPSGVPPFWAAAKTRIDSGTPGGVKKVAQYDNYLLASQSTVLRTYSGAIKGYQQQGLMPMPATGLTDPYLTSEVYPVGPLPGNATEWRDSLMRLGGLLGTTRQGDPHLIVVTDKRITDPDEYALAVQAHWQSPEIGKRALSKNGVVLIVGSTDGKTVQWARAFTGMPVGNEALAQNVRSALVGAPLTPQGLLALPQGAHTLTKDNAATVATATGVGAIPKALLGQTGFTRACMKGCGDGDLGYTYLIDEIDPTTGQKVTIVSVGLLAALAVWAALFAFDIPTPRFLTGDRTDKDQRPRRTRRRTLLPD